MRLLAGIIALCVGAIAQSSTSRLVTSANAFLASLDDKQRASVSYTFDDQAQRTRWSNFPIVMVPRGGISLKGTLAGTAGAAVITAVATLLFRFTAAELAIAFAAAIAGLFFDSLLGATLERRGWLNNDAVNALSTLAAALLAALAASQF